MDPFEALQTALRRELEPVYSECSNGERSLFTILYNRARHDVFDGQLGRAKFETPNADTPAESSIHVPDTRIQSLDRNLENPDELMALCKDIEHDMASAVLDEFARGRISCY